MNRKLQRILKGAVEHNASDVHLARGMSPLFRIDGQITPVAGEPLDEETLFEILADVATPRQREIFDQTWQLCFSQEQEGVGRYRASVSTRSGCPEFSIRICEASVRSPSKLGLPPIVEELTHRTSGLILVTGPTGVGKTTTLNGLVDAVNRHRRAKIITIEDPVEYVHRNLRQLSSIHS